MMKKPSWVLSLSIIVLFVTISICSAMVYPVTKLSCYSDLHPQIHNGQVVWYGHFPDPGIFYWDGSIVPVQIKRVVLKDLDQGAVITNDFSPGTNIQYIVRFTVDGDPDTLYKVAANGEAVSLYKPDGINPEWIDNFGSKRKAKKLYVGEVKKIQWKRQIPPTATPDKKARVKLVIRLREYDESTGTWNKLGLVRWRKDFNIVP